MSRGLWIVFLAGSLSLTLGWAGDAGAQNSSAPPSPANSQATAPASSSSQAPPQPSNVPPTPATSTASTSHNPNLDPPRSDRVNVHDLDKAPGESSSKDTPVDLNPPSDDDKAHPQSSTALIDAELSSGDVSEMHPWDPHKAAKNIEVAEFYFKRQNYHAAEERYREALLYKENDATAMFGLARSLDKQNRVDEAREAYESYLKILPHGHEAEEAQKALARLKSSK